MARQLEHTTSSHTLISEMDYPGGRPPANSMSMVGIALKAILISWTIAMAVKMLRRPDIICRLTQVCAAIPFLHTVFFVLYLLGGFFLEAIHARRAQLSTETMMFSTDLIFPVVLGAISEARTCIGQKLARDRLFCKWMGFIIASVVAQTAAFMRTQTKSPHAAAEVPPDSVHLVKVPYTQWYAILDEEATEQARQKLINSSPSFCDCDRLAQDTIINLVVQDIQKFETQFSHVYTTKKAFLIAAESVKLQFTTDWFEIYPVRLVSPPPNHTEVTTRIFAIFITFVVLVTLGFGPITEVASSLPSAVAPAPVPAVDYREALDLEEPRIQRASDESNTSQRRASNDSGYWSPPKTPVDKNDVFPDVKQMKLAW
ncbi:hypothetical protein LTR64_002541 [Lithohypha guttulata]|uniref:uncharacterized protein n=1 Tax=Lithohypha guttulata TaxID=1690604 RepID=UPI002DDF7220|nr:hypothetical protein LTR51_001233 [Lithohypha guttulata]